MGTVQYFSLLVLGSSPRKFRDICKGNLGGVSTITGQEHDHDSKQSAGVGSSKDSNVNGHQAKERRERKDKVRTKF